MRNALAIAVVMTAGCAEHRPREESCPTWQGEIAAALETCAGCHGGASPAGDYDVTSYLGALGSGSDDVANAIAGDVASRLITAIDPARVAPGDTAHAGQGALHALLVRWVGDCDVAYLDSTIHPAGVLDPSSTGFHGAEVQARGWDLDLCATCHGVDFTGGPADAACTTCHTRGPDACDTCHDEVPTTGAHGAHVGAGSAGIACETCHRVPARWDDEGHVRRDGAGDPAPAEVEMTGLAAITVDAADRAGPPVFEAGTCRNVYCHGDVLGASGGDARRPSWASDPPGPAACSSCHGAPPPSHADAACATCHPTGAGTTAHLDGTTDVGTGGSGCNACHGTPGSPAPPRDLAGNIFTTALGVGAHQAHLRAPSGLSAPIACSACHVVPADLMSPGHIDSTGPAEVVASLGWDRVAATCASAWCHGPARPRWTETGGAACGTCHGAPPATAPHTAGMSLTTCATCHPATMDSVGRFIPGGAHLDGDIDAP
jgi:predicted CxxxxCH...CXXCH cytochrome family protein